MSETGSSPETEKAATATPESTSQSIKTVNIKDLLSVKAPTESDKVKAAVALFPEVDTHLMSAKEKIDYAKTFRKTGQILGKKQEPSILDEDDDIAA